MPGASKLLDRQAQEQVVEAIREAERATSAEIRVHIENHCRGDVLDRATEVFSELKMDRTELRNGVLIYVAVKDRKTAIIGDSGINRYVRREFWDTCYRAMSGHFAAGDFVESQRQRLLVGRARDLDRRLQLDGAVALAAHHVVDVVRALGSERAQQETIVVSLVQQDVDLRFDNAHMGLTS